MLCGVLADEGILEADTEIVGVEGGAKEAKLGVNTGLKHHVRRFLPSGEHVAC